jgi:hypothetical protein
MRISKGRLRFVNFFVAAVRVLHLLLLAAPRRSAAFGSVAGWSPPPSYRATTVASSGAIEPVGGRRRLQTAHRPAKVLASSFYGDFEKFDEDDEDDDDEGEESGEEEGEEASDDEEGEQDDDPLVDGASLAAFRSRMDFLFDDDADGGGAASGVDELIRYARSQQGGGLAKEEDTAWARVATSVSDGVVLIANPAKFCADLGTSAPSPPLLSKFGLTMPPPPELGPDRRADLLPVVILVETPASGKDAAGGGSKRVRGVLLNRRTGYLLGDLEQPGSSFDASGDDGGGSGSGSAGPRPLLEKFCIQPLWFGGVDSVTSGLDMLHQCPSVVGCRKITDDGLFWGGDPSQAQTAMEEAATADRVMTGFDFKFFVQSTVWRPGDLEKQIDSETWFLASVSKEVLFKPRDRMGTRRAKVRPRPAPPFLWVASCRHVALAIPPARALTEHFSLPLPRRRGRDASPCGPSAWSSSAGGTRRFGTSSTKYRASATSPVLIARLLPHLFFRGTLLLQQNDS